MTNAGFDRLADTYGFIAAYPDGFEGNWNDCRRKARDSAHILDIDDVGFISALIDFFIANYSVDPSRIFIAGMSNGGQMCLRLASEISWKITGIAPLLAQIPEPGNSVCTEIEFNHDMPVLLLSGTKDPISPYKGGEVSLFGIIRWGRVISVDETVQYWLDANGIKTGAAAERVFEDPAGSGMKIVNRVWDKLGRDLVCHYVVHGGGHTMPGSDHLPGFIFGRTADHLDMSAEVVKFFIDVEPKKE